MVTKHTRTGLGTPGAGKGDKDRPVDIKKWKANFSDIKWSGTSGLQPVKANSSHLRKTY